MSQVAVASTQSRIDDRHNRVILYVEQDIEPVTDEELAELCRLAAEQTINLADAELIDLIDRMGQNGRVFM